ncbi:MAG TPA: RHS repeat-associated core domain-containing protein [Pyrinomonadaceae bacterium]|nr:RHS repeat-associated core domain-containing protein [Pyrinomonadaceae bacterium]
MFYPSGYLMLRDGMRYRIDDGKVTWMRDRNGNKLTFTYGAGGGGRVTKIADSLNREVTFAYDVQEGGDYGVCDHITFKGYGGAERKIRVSHTTLENALRTGFSPQTPAQLFPELNGSESTNFNPTVASAVWLPNDPGDPTTMRKYSFYYNSYGELARVVLPTGGAIEYDWAAGATGGYASGYTGLGVYRRVTARREYANGSTLTQTMTISRPESAAGGLNFNNLGYVDVQFGSAAVGKVRHYFYGSPTESFNRDAVSYSPWREGREYKTEYFAANGTTVLKRVEHTFAQRAAVSWWAGTADAEPPNDTRTTETVTTLVDTNQVSKQSAINPQTLEVGFDQYNNQTDVYEYDYGTGAPGALVRRARTDYLTANLIGSASYNYATDMAIHMRSLPKRTSIYDAAGAEQARTTYEYDNYTATANHAGLVARSLISGLDSAYTTAKKTRGNVTAATRYLFNGGNVSGSVSTYRQYDVAGNVVKAIDSLGNVTVFTFTDSFGGPDAEAHINFIPQPLVTQSGTFQSYAFPSLVTNDMGHTAFIQRDYYTGLMVDAEDANGVTSSAYYEDHLDRPTKVIRAASDDDLQNQTIFTYNDASRFITTTSEFDAHNDQTPLKSQILYDGLGRTTEMRSFETATTFIAVRKTYDALGRVRQVSNPFRSGTPVWTTTAYDPLGRVTSVSTADNAVVTINYTGSTSTVTDQTGRDRQGTRDAFGRLIQVVEDPGTGGLGYATTYTYDLLGNLRKVTQGSQARYFMYDSLSRLIRAKSPEQDSNASLALTDPVTGNAQWSIAYAYDDNGNPLTRTDARNLTTEYGYDDLNRNTSVTYKSGTVTQARVVRTYDTATNGVGRLASSYYYIDTGTNAGAHSQTTVDGYDAMGRPLSQSQYFYANGSWGTPYVTQRTYNLAGAMTSQTYPSGRTVNYAYDLAGRALSFTGNLGDGVARNYATSITYDQWGGLTRERFGTATPLYHKERRNVRGQLYDVRLSTVNDANNWNRGAITNYYSVPTNGPNLTSPDNTVLSGTDNNGNLHLQQHWVPEGDATTDITSSSFMQQNYDYDQLNRIKSVTEYPDGNTAAPTGKQVFNYDQFGNRSIDPASWGAGINEQQFTVNVGNKNQLGVPAGLNKVMQYDPMGNLYNDTYSGTGSRTYDFENRMVTATNTANQQSVYTYDANGSRVRRKSYGEETWQVYGMDGELLAEYAASSAPASSLKEYGYRNGQLLVTAEAEGRKNVALASEGGVATASSQHSTGTAPGGAINGDRRGINWGTSGGWADAAATPFPEWLEVAFSGMKTIDEIDVVGLQDGLATLEPTEAMTFTQYGLTDFEVQYWNGTAWVTVTGGSVTGNNKVWKKFTFAAVSTSKIRVSVTGGVGGRARIVEVEAWQAASVAADVRWLVPDHLGTPRIVADKTGSLAGITRHDYLPFGEELFAGTGNRTPAQGYPSSQSSGGVRQQFTQYERDIETGLDYAQARYYAGIQGRFTSVDPLLASARLSNPQSWNRYSYVLNNPLRYTDPLGLTVQLTGAKEDQEQEELKRAIREQGFDLNSKREVTRLGGKPGYDVSTTVYAGSDTTCLICALAAGGMGLGGTAAGTGKIVTGILAAGAAGILITGSGNDHGIIDTTVDGDDDNDFSIDDAGRDLDIRDHGPRGRAFEAEVLEMSGLEKNTEAITAPGIGTTIPDAITSREVIEIKDVRTLSLTKQIRAQLQIARQRGLGYRLIISDRTTHLSRPLVDAIRAAGGSIVRYRRPPLA